MKKSLSGSFQKPGEGIFLHRISTLVPPHQYSQEYARDRMKQWVEDPRLARLVHAIYQRSGIETRHSVSADFKLDQQGGLFRMDAQGRLIPPTTAQRNALYAAESRTLAVEAARDAIDGCPGVSRDDVTHVIFASCTGFANPGPDYYIIRDLGLPEGVERYTLGFMGCYAAFPALRMASQFCAANPGAVVLVVCLELCSLHIQVNDQPDTMLANSLFSDGVAAAIVSARSPAREVAAFRLEGFASALLPAGEAAMAWAIGDHGFDITLSSYVPDILGANLETNIGNVLARHGLERSAVETWAVHPGGRAILDKVERTLGLDATALAVPRRVLSRYGNMSSATILFVLAGLLEQSQEMSPGLTCAMAFGPGLTLETALLQHIPAGADTAADDVNSAELLASAEG